jgi:hypothetical protein
MAGTGRCPSCPWSRRLPSEMPGEIEAFIRTAASARGINPDIAVRVCETEGGVTEPARLGDFSGPPWYSGKSWWALQLHYGGAGTPYAAWGGSAGMGNGFTTLTGWTPGTEAAWRDAARYGLNRARTGGWQSWYGAQSVGITGFMGVDRQHPWDANSEVWDYETSTAVPLPRVVYAPSEPPHPQESDWDCSQDSAEWALFSVGRRPSNGWMESAMIEEGVLSPSVGLLDASGQGLSSFLVRHYGEYGFTSTSVSPVSFDALAAESGRCPMLIGGRRWGAGGHWSGLRAFDAERGVLLLSNPAAGYTGINQEMTRAQFDARGSWSAVTLDHPDLTAAITDPTPIPPPVPVYPPPEELLGQIAAQQAYIQRLETRLGVASVDYADDLDGLARGVANVAAALRALHPPTGRSHGQEGTS